MQIDSNCGIYKNEYSKYTAGGADGLYDRERGSVNFRDGYWQRFEREDMDITFELVNLQKVNKITVGFLDNIGYWIYLPVLLEVYISRDGKEFKKISTLSKEGIKDFPEEDIKNISITLNNVEAKYIRIFAKNINAIPATNPGAGGKAWVFCDEVIIE